MNSNALRSCKALKFAYKDHTEIHPTEYYLITTQEKHATDCYTGVARNSVLKGPFGNPSQLVLKAHKDTEGVIRSCHTRALILVADLGLWNEIPIYLEFRSRNHRLAPRLIG